MTKPPPPKAFSQQVFEYIVLGKVPERRTRKPPRTTLASVAKQANKAAIDVARYEVRPDNTIVVVTGKSDPVVPEDPWPLDEFRTKDIKQ